MFLSGLFATLTKCLKGCLLQMFSYSWCDNLKMRLTKMTGISARDATASENLHFWRKKLFLPVSSHSYRVNHSWRSWQLKIYTWHQSSYFESAKIFISFIYIYLSLIYIFVLLYLTSVLMFWICNMAKMYGMTTRQSKQGGFCIFHTETCEPCPLYDTFYHLRCITFNPNFICVFV